MTSSWFRSFAPRFGCFELCYQLNYVLQLLAISHDQFCLCCYAKYSLVITSGTQGIWIHKLNALSKIMTVSMKVPAFNQVENLYNELDVCTLNKPINTTDICFKYRRYFRLWQVSCLGRNKLGITPSNKYKNPNIVWQDTVYRQTFNAAPTTSSFST